MDTLNRYRAIVESVLTPYAERRYSDTEITNEAVYDRSHDRYLIVSVGWQGVRRVQHCLLHLDIINGKIWIQRDGTEDGIADELESAGIPKSDIVLAFHPEKDRIILGEYAVV